MNKRQSKKLLKKAFGVDRAGKKRFKRFTRAMCYATRMAIRRSAVLYATEGSAS